MNCEKNSVMDSPMDIVYTTSSSKRLVRSDSGGKRKLDDDSGYFTTPGSSMSSYNTITPDASFIGHSSIEFTPYEAIVSSSTAPTPNKIRKSCHSLSPFRRSDDFGCYEAMEVCSYSEELSSLSPEVMKIIPDGLSPILRAASLTPKKCRPLFSCGVPNRTRDLPKPRRKLKLSSYRSPRLKERVQLTYQETVDFIFYFGIEYDFKIILSEIFKYLGDEDICKMTMVSKGWHKVCMDMPEIKSRWRNCVSLRRQIKENIPFLHSKGHLRSPLRTTSLNHSALGSPSSPPVSPDKFRFSLFRKAAQTLRAEEQLVDCPDCSRPSRCTPGQNRGICTWKGCSLEFCTNCRSPFHDPEPCQVVPIPGDCTPQKSRPIVILSNKSRQNLRRLMIP